MINIDWLDIILPCYHETSISGGFNARFTCKEGSNFNELSDIELDYKTPTHRTVTGSHSSTITIKTVDLFDDYMFDKEGDLNRFIIDRLYPYLPEDYGNSLLLGQGKPAHYGKANFFIRVSGNFGKFLQGQSLFCPSDPFGLYFDFIIHLVQKLGISPLSQDIRKWRNGFVIPMRIDINKNWQYKNPKQVDELITSLVKSGSINGRSFVFPRGVSRKVKGLACVNDTLGKDLRFIFYNKCEEMLQHLKIDKDDVELCHYHAKLINEAYGVLRGELSLRSSWFKRRKSSNFYKFYKTGQTFEAVYNRTVLSIEIGASNMNDNKLENLKTKIPKHVLPTYMMWLDGLNIAQIKTVLGGGVRSKTADQMYWRHSKLLKDDFGINIKVRRIGQEAKVKSNVVPMLRVLEATEKEIPQWMIDEGLIYKPNKHLLTVVK